MTADKVCSKCGRLLPLEKFSHTGKGYLRPECRECCRFTLLCAKPTLPEVRTCTLCGQEKPIGEFPISTGKYRRHQCHTCYKAQRLTYYRRNSESPEFRAHRSLLKKKRAMKRVLQAARS